MPRPRSYPPDFCTLTEIAYLVSMSPQTFQQNVRAGILPKPIFIGGKRLWSRERVVNTIEDMTDPHFSEARGGILEAIGGEKTSA